MEDLTLKQKEVFKQIKKFLEAKGYSPSVRELCNLCNVSSPATMQEHIKHLEEKGYITKSKNNSRTIRIKSNFNNNDLQTRIDKAIEYLTSYESISTIQGLDNIEKNKQLDENTMNIMTSRYLDVHHNLLNILKGDEKE